MYEYHYIKKIRPTWTSSALIFGDALDKAINELLMKTENDPYETFLKCWTNGVINKAPIYIPTTTKLLYANKDYESSLLTPSDYEEIAKRIASGEIKQFKFSELVIKKKEESWDKLTDDEKSFFNLHNWLCMKNKAKYIIEGYKTKILPKITKVHCVQKEIKADNGSGDELSGFIDFIADVEGHGTVILDNKSSARDYEWDSPSKSTQLALYVHMEGDNYNTRKAGFIVMKKNLNYNRVKTCKECNHIGKSSHKTCDNMIDPPMTGPGTGKAYRCNGDWAEVVTPEAEFQVIIQDMPKQFETMTIENIDVVTQAIGTGIFPKNTDRCRDHFGGNCPYLDLCMSGGKTMKGLCKEEESK
jgi:hypothetical protein